MTDPRELSECPKCGLKASTLLHRFCTHADCPVRKPKPVKTLNHAPDCDWHCDQYDWECTCGAAYPATNTPTPEGGAGYGTASTTDASQSPGMPSLQSQGQNNG